MDLVQGMITIFTCLQQN